MASQNAKLYWRTLPGGLGLNGVTLTAKRMSDAATIASGVTAGLGAEAGKADIAVGYPGPHYIEGTSGDTTLRSSSRDVGFIGTFSGADLPLAFRDMTDGVIDNYLLELAVSAGAGLSVNVATGAHRSLGHPFENTATTNVPLAPADPTNPRIDRVVVRFYPIGATLEGKFELAALTGTPAATPVAPTPTKDSAAWEISLAQVPVAAGAASPGTITDERVFSAPVTVKGSSVTGDLNVTSVVSGSVSANSLTSLVSASLQGDTTITNILGRAAFKSTAPTVVATPSGTYPGAGVSPTVVNPVVGSDVAGQVSLTRGTSSGSGSLFKLVFATVKPTTNYSVVLFPRSFNARSASVHCSARNADGFTIDIAAGGTSGDQLNWDYQVMEFANP